MGGYFKWLPVAGGRGWQVLGGGGVMRGQRKGRSTVGVHRGVESPSEPQHGGEGGIPPPSHACILSTGWAKRSKEQSGDQQK